MADYTIHYTDDSKTAITIPSGGTRNASLLTLIGQAYTNYGEVIGQNFLRLLENFADVDPPVNPIEGQLWYDNDENRLKVFDSTAEYNDYGNDNGWNTLANIIISDTEPTTTGTDARKEGRFWYNTDEDTLSVSDADGNWDSIGGSGTTGGTKIIARTRDDTNGNSHETLEAVVDDDIVFIVSSDDEWTPATDEKVDPSDNTSDDLDTVFSTIKKGIHLNSDSDYLFHGTATAAQYSDLAERYHADRAYSYGTVVKIGGLNEITETTTYKDTDVLGIISQNPGFRMNSEAGPDNTHPYVALSGRVPVKVMGFVRKGERLVSSNMPGHAMADRSTYDTIDFRSIIGRALENKTTDDPGVIEVIVGTK